MMKSSVFQEDYKMISELPFIDWECFRDTTILITGATGVYGYSVTSGRYNF